MLGLEVKKEGRKGKDEIFEEIFKLFFILKIMLLRMGGNLSGG